MLDFVPSVKATMQLFRDHFSFSLFSLEPYVIGFLVCNEWQITGGRNDIAVVFQ